MCTKEETKKLAYFIWEKEGRPQGKDEQNYLLAEQILLRLEMTQIVKDVVDVKDMLKKNDKTTWYQFRLNFAVVAIAIGATLSFINPPIQIAGTKSPIWGGILSLTSLVLIVLPDTVYQPETFHIRTVKTVTWVMFADIIMIPLGSLTAHFNLSLLAEILQLGGILMFIVGLYLAIFSKRKLVTNREH